MLKYTFTNQSHKIFFTSDTHFDHERIIDLCERPFKDVYEMNLTLINNWNSVVSASDTIFILGDFCFSNKNRWNQILDKLNGTKILILGNHDKEKSIDVSKFENIGDLAQVSIYNNETKKYDIIILCHYCLTSWPSQWKGSYHIFGHSHSRPNNTCLDSEFIKNRVQPSYDVGVDNNNYKPISYEELLIKLNE